MSVNVCLGIGIYTQLSSAGTQTTGTDLVLTEIFHLTNRVTHIVTHSDATNMARITRKQCSKM